MYVLYSKAPYLSIFLQSRGLKVDIHYSSPVFSFENRIIKYFKLYTCIMYIAQGSERMEAKEDAIGFIFRWKTVTIYALSPHATPNYLFRCKKMIFRGDNFTVIPKFSPQMTIVISDDINKDIRLYPVCSQNFHKHFGTVSGEEIRTEFFFITVFVTSECFMNKINIHVHE